MRSVSRILGLGIVTVAFFIAIALPARVSAQGVQDFVITNFDATYTLTNEDPQGLLTVTEIIDVNFSGQNQGILRAIPQTYKGNDLRLKVISSDRDGEIEPFITYTENDNVVIRIGQAGTFITGEHQYVINYQLENVVTFYDEYDEFFWDVNGDQWLQPFENVSVSLDTQATRDDTRDPECFTGQFGSTERNCEVFEQVRGLDAESTETLQPGETLTILQAYEKGYFSPPGFLERYREYVIAAPLLLVQLLVVQSARNKWSRLGKDYKQRAVAPFYGRPKGVSVMQASYVANNRLTTKDLSASLIDLAIRGYLKVVEQKDGRKTKHTLEMMKAPDKKLSPDELKLVNAIFKKGEVGEQFTIEDNKHKLSSVWQSLSKDLDKAAKEKGFYEISPRSAAKHLWKQAVVAAILLAGSIVIASVSTPLVVFTAVGAFAAVITYMALMSKRSHRGVELKEHVEGLKLYLGMAEKDRLAAHDAVAAPLSTRGRPPKYDRKFFEKLLPFAIAAGVEKTWAKAFADIYSQPPEWYSGSTRAITAGVLANSLGDTVKATSQTFTSPSSSSGSGFSGGSAGGGGGGGGGGGW